MGERRLSSWGGDPCVEVAYRTDAVHVRDSKEMDGPQFSVSASK
ncbi:DUF397 domain-containing protein [Streptomyces pseudoechinosporeus]